MAAQSRAKSPDPSSPAGVSVSECQSPGGLREPQVSHQAGGHLGRAGWCELRVLQCSRPYSSSGVQHSAAPLSKYVVVRGNRQMSSRKSKAGWWD